LSERYVDDQISIQQFQRSIPGEDYTRDVLSACATIAAALKINYDSLPFYRIRKYILKRQLSARSLMKKLVRSEIVELSKKVLILEGVDPKEFEKKKSGKKE
jgi:hypothetical protein